MSICPRCHSEAAYQLGDDPAPNVRCMDCGMMYVPQKRPTSHETLKKIEHELEQIKTHQSDIFTQLDSIRVLVKTAIVSADIASIRRK